MFVILTYDVSHKRANKVMKICRKYLHHIQYSVFEGMITEGRLGSLKRELNACIVYKEDSIFIYELNNLKYTRKEMIGVNRLNDNIL